MQAIKIEILHKLAGKSEQDQLNYYIELVNWATRNAQIIQDRMRTPFLEIVVDEPSDILVESTDASVS